VIKLVSDLWLVDGFNPGTLVSPPNRIDRHDITEILLKVALNTITLTQARKVSNHIYVTVLRVSNPSQESKQSYLCDCVRDVIDDISTDTADGIVTVNDYLIYLILFADDTVLFGKTPEILQHLLDKLFIYCRKWNIEVNTDKTKVVVFRNSWRLVNDHFFYDNMELKIVDSYVYLGMLLHYNGKFLQTEKRLSQQGAHALSSLMNSLKIVYISTEQ
jgi:hypothetical protein